MWSKVDTITGTPNTGQGGSANNDKESLSIFTDPSAPAGYETRSIFKRSLTGWN